MIRIKDKAKATQLRHELAAELSKREPDPIEIQRIRTEIFKAGYRCGAQPPHVQKWSSNAADC